MKFIITAVAAVVATSTVVSGMEAPELRGPVLIDALMGSSKSSKSNNGSSRASGSGSSKSSKGSADLFDRQFVDVGTSSKSSKSNNGSSRASGSGSSKSSKGSADMFDRQFADVGTSSKSSKSNNGSSRAASSSKSSKSSADLFDRQFVDVGTSSKSSKSNSGSARAGDSGSKSSKSSSDMFEDRQFEEVAIPKFFPADMSEELLDEFRNNRNRNSGGNPNKQNASQKRQAQRDARRESDNPNRSQREEDKERARKTQQSERRGNRSTDPYDDSSGQRDYGARREATRVRTCERTGDSCRFSGPNSWCYNDCVDDIGSRGRARNGRDGGQRVDQECSRQCRFIDAACYDICRNDDGDSISFCLDDCEKNIDDDDMRRRIENRSDRSDYPRINDCEARCRTVTNRNGRRTACFLDCDDDFDEWSSSNGDEFRDFSCNDCRDINNRNRRDDCLDENRCR